MRRGIVIMLNNDPGTNMDATRRPIPRRAQTAAAALALLALGGAATACQEAAGSDAAPTPEVTRAPGPVQRARPAGVPHRGIAPGTTFRQTPDLLADLEPRVGPQTAERLRGARDAGRAFAQRIGVEGPDAQGIADIFTELAYDVARAERDTSAGSDERTSAVQRAAEDAIDGLDRLVPATARAEAEHEIALWTGGVTVTFAHPAPAAAEAPLP